MSLVGKLDCLPCHHVHSFHKKRRRRKKKTALKKNKTVEIFLGKVRLSVPGAEGQLLRQRNFNVKLDYMYNFLIKKRKHFTTKYGLFGLHTQNTVLYQIFSPGPSSFFFLEEKLNTVMPWRVINSKLATFKSFFCFFLAGSGAE